MARPFVASFLLPLVRGGRLHVGRPLSLPSIDVLGRGVVPFGPSESALGEARLAVAALFLGGAETPPLDETTLRLGAALHDLLVLVHPGLGGAGSAGRHARVAEAARVLADVGPPPTETEAVRRHSLLARMPEIARTDRTVHFWLGQQTYVGRVPPARVTALPELRRVRVEAVRRAWMREIGVPAVAREAVLALATASPLGEALEPSRLEPPLAWSRILPVLRGPRTGRVVAARLVEEGLARAGEALASALFRFASFQDPAGGAPATPEAVAFALRFLAHLAWLDLLFGPAAGGEAGATLGALLTVADEVAPALVWPPDVPAPGDLGRSFRARLQRLEAARGGSSSLDAARGVVAFASPAVASAARLSLSRPSMPGSPPRVPG
jgi:hypothetical protein